MLIVTSTTSLFKGEGPKFIQLLSMKQNCKNVRFFPHLNHHQLLRDLLYAAVNNCLLISNIHPASDPLLAGFVPDHCSYQIPVCFRSPTPVIGRSVHTRSLTSVTDCCLYHLSPCPQQTPPSLPEFPPLSLPDLHHSSARPLPEPGINFSMLLLSKAASIRSSFNLSTADNATGSNFCPHHPWYERKNIILNKKADSSRRAFSPEGCSRLSRDTPFGLQHSAHREGPSGLQLHALKFTSPLPEPPGP